MKYKYRKSAVIFYYLVAGVFCLIFGMSLKFEGNPSFNEQFVKISSLTVVGMGISFSVYWREYFNRYVEIQNEYIRFNSFRYKMVKNVVSTDVKYEDIISFEVKKTPLFRLWWIKIKASTLPGDVSLTVSFCRHKEMFREICKKMKEHKPEFEIDSKFLEYLGENNKE